MADLAVIVEAMKDPGFYPHEPRDVEIRETESSFVFLADDRAYKLKKPLNRPDQNYSTPARRRRMCNLEVELGQRLSPHLYYGVQKVTSRRGGFTLNGRGKVADYVIEMKRLSDDRCLADMVRADVATDEQMGELARKLVQFHRDAERRQLINSFSRPHIIARQWNRRFRSSAEYVGSIFSAGVYRDIVTYASYFLSDNRSLFQERIDKGYICDGHGNLIADHIYVDNAIQVIDCVEYNDRQRFRDVAFDLAGLVMSLDSLGVPDLSDVLIEEYRRDSGIQLQPVLDFYLCFRAYDRALNYSRRANKMDIPLAEHQELMKAARRFYHLAYRYSRGDRQPLLLIMTGVTGVGKTELASALADVLSIRHLEAANIEERFAEAQDDGKVDDAELAREVDRAYDELLKRAERQLKRGRSVVLDATFHNSTYRIAARTLAREYGAEFLAVECDAEEEILRERVREQAADDSGSSQERLHLLREQRRAFQPSREIYRKDKVQVDTTESLDEQVETVLAEL